MKRAPPPPFANPWRTVDAKVVYENAWMRVREDAVVKPSGGAGVYGVMSPHGYATGVLPLFDNGDTVLVGQWRYPLGGFSWELPEGGSDKAVEPLAGAQRELKEETGLTARDWRPLAKLHTSNCLTDETAFCFLAMDLSEGEPSPDDTEKLAVRRMPFASVLALTLRDEITDAMSVVMVLRAHALAMSGALPPQISKAMLGR